jgi:hypothetical protein
VGDRGDFQITCTTKKTARVPQNGLNVRNAKAWQNRQEIASLLRWSNAA